MIDDKALRDKERMEAYRRDLEEIGKTIGCDHIDDGLQRCVESTIDDLTADNARLQSERELLRELLRECLAVVPARPTLAPGEIMCVGGMTEALWNLHDRIKAVIGEVS